MVVRAPGREGSVRYGLVAGRKIGNAVERNRVKRRLRHAIRDARLRVGYDYVVLAAPEVLDAPYDVLVRWIRQVDEETSRE